MIRHKLGAGVDLNVDLDPAVEVDGSEAVRTRLTPPSTSTQLPLSVQDSRPTIVHVQRRPWAQRRTSPSTSTPAVNDHVYVDDHGAMDRTCDESSDVEVRGG